MIDMNYRPITDVWLLSRPKVKFYGAYPSGFLERARALLGVSRDESVLHVCGGRAKDYPAWAWLCPHDWTMDLDPALEPNIVHDVRESFADRYNPTGAGWPGILCDPPYTREDAARYSPGPDTWPSPRLVLRHALEAVRPGGRVGMLHYLAPRPPHLMVGVRFVACIGIIVGFGNRGRWYTVYERP